MKALFCVLLAFIIAAEKSAIKYHVFLLVILDILQFH